MKLPIARFIRKLFSQIVGGHGWRPWIHEPFAGAWQRNIREDSESDLTRNSALFACLTLLAGDAAKLPLNLMRMSRNHNGIWLDATHSALEVDYAAVLRKPNAYQTLTQFVEHMTLSLLLSGNCYLLKERLPKSGWSSAEMQSLAGVVTQLHVLSPQRIMPLVSDSGEILYQLQPDNLAGIEGTITVPGDDIIHARINTLFHPLVGVSPLHAAAWSTTLGNRAIRGSARFFANMSRPSGILTAPGAISDETAVRLKKDTEDAVSGRELGRLMVLGDGLKFDAMGLTNEASQLAEQLAFTATDICRAFKIPPHMIAAASPPAGLSVEALTANYYSTALQSLLETMENSLDDGLDLPRYFRCEFDLDALLRMDRKSRYEAYQAAIRGGWMAPNEARRAENLAPVEGGDTPYMQHQDYSLAALAKRDARPDPFETGADKAAKQNAGTRVLELRLEQDRLTREYMRERGREWNGPAPEPTYMTRIEPSQRMRRAIVHARRRQAMKQHFEESDQ